MQPPHSAMSPQASPRKTTNESEVLETVKAPYTRSISSSPSPAFPIVIKVSNSDDEDMATEAQALRRGMSNANSAAVALPHIQSFVESQSPPGSTQAKITYSNTQVAYHASSLACMGMPYGVGHYVPSHMAADKENEMPSPFVVGLPGMDLPGSVNRSVRSRQESSRSSSEISSAYFSASINATRNEPGIPSSHTCQPPQYDKQPPLSQAGSMLPSFRTAIRSPQQSSQPPSQVSFTQSVINAANKDNQRPSSNTEYAFPPILARGSNVRENEEAFLDSHKHTTTPPRRHPTKRVRNKFGSGFAPGNIKLPYQTTKSIRMPQRTDLVPGQEPPEPTASNLPYGDTEDYRSSMLIYWLDEKEHTYLDAAKLYRERFPGQTSNDDTIRRMHLRSLQRLARKYGVKSDSEIEEPGKKVLRRGRQAGAKYIRAIGPTAAAYAASDAQGDATATNGHQGRTMAPSIRPQVNKSPEMQGCLKRTTNPLATRGFQLACIVVWKDSLDVSFEQIQQKLVEEFGWKLGTNTIQKLYYSERGQVYNALGAIDEDDESNMGDTETTKEAVEGDDKHSAASEDLNSHFVGAKVVRRRSL